MIMIGMLIDKLINVRIKILAVHPFVMSSRNHMEQMPYHRIDEERLPDIVPIKSPGVGGPLANDFKRSTGRMIAPNPTVELLPFGSGCSGCANMRSALDAMPSIKPAVRPPAQAVDDIMMHLIILPAIQENFRLTIRHEVPIAIRYEQKPRRAKHVNTAK